MTDCKFKINIIGLFQMVTVFMARLSRLGQKIIKLYNRGALARFWDYY